MEKMELLEEKIRKAVEVIRALKEERRALETQLRSAQNEIKQLSARQPDTEITGRIERLTKERVAITEHVERMISIIEAVEAN